MECSFDIDVKEPDTIQRMFNPSVKFKINQLNMTPDCYTDSEIDYQINELIHYAEKLRKKVKKDLKDAKARHDKLISENKPS